MLHKDGEIKISYQMQNTDIDISLIFCSASAYLFKLYLKLFKLDLLHNRLIWNNEPNTNWVQVVSFVYYLKGPYTNEGFETYVDLALFDNNYFVSNSVFISNIFKILSLKAIFLTFLYSLFVMIGIDFIIFFATKILLLEMKIFTL